MQFTNFNKAVHYLIHEIPKTKHSTFDDAKTIEKNYKIMELLGNPQNSHPVIHVAGTSGKGTICYLIDGILRAHTKKTGMIVSPHVYDIRERIQINGQLVSERQFTNALNVVIERLRGTSIEISYFEVFVAMAFHLFKKIPLDYTILETGLGGRLDGTNVVTTKKVCVLGQIGLDHTAILGDTLTKIATEKAGIVQQGSSVVALRQSPEVNLVFEERCKEMNAEIFWIERSDDYQETNNRLAKAACEVASVCDGWHIDEELVESVLQQTFIPGRFEKRHYKDHLLILDGAHNPQKLSAFAKRIERENKAPVTLLFTLGEHKDLHACLMAVKPVVKRIIATEYFAEQQDIPVRPQPAEDIAKICEELDIDSLVYKLPRNALEKAVEFAEPIAASGSFYILSEIDSAMS